MVLSAHGRASEGGMSFLFGRVKTSSKLGCRLSILHPLPVLSPQIHHQSCGRKDGQQGNK